MLNPRLTYSVRNIFMLKNCFFDRRVQKQCQHILNHINIIYYYTKYNVDQICAGRIFSPSPHSSIQARDAMPCLLSVGVPKIWCSHGKQFLFGFKDAGQKPGTLCSWMWIPPNFIGNLTHTHVAEMSIICYVVMLYPDFSYVVLMKNQVSMNILLCFVFNIYGLIYIYNL